MDTREISDMRVSAEFLINGNSVKERPAARPRYSSTAGAPTRAPAGPGRPFLECTIPCSVSAAAD